MYTISTVAAAATGAVPIPLSDAAVLVPEKIAMLGEIMAVSGIPIEKGTIVALGETYIIIMVMICKGDLSTVDLSTDKGKKEVTKIFTEQLKVKRKHNGEPRA